MQSIKLIVMIISILFCVACSRNDVLEADGVATLQPEPKRSPPATCAAAATHPVETPDLQRAVWSWDIDAQSALKVCQNAVAKDPNDSISLFHLGRIQQVSGDLIAAIDSYRKASSIGLPLADLQLAQISSVIGDSENEEFFTKRAEEGFEHQFDIGNPAGAMGLIYVGVLKEQKKKTSLDAYASYASRDGYGDTVVFLALQIRDQALLAQSPSSEKLLRYSDSILQYAANWGHPEAALQAALGLLRPAEKIYARGGYDREYFVMNTLGDVRRLLGIARKNGALAERVNPLQTAVDDIQSRYDSRGSVALMTVIGALAVMAQKEAEDGGYAKWMREQQQTASSRIGPNPVYCGILASNAYGGTSGASSAYLYAGC